MLHSLKYIGFYTTPSVTPLRSISLAARNKMDYTIDVLKECVDQIEIISPANTTKGQRGCRSQLIDIDTKTKLKLFGNLPVINNLLLYINRKITNIRLFFYLITHTKKNEPILVYHSLVTTSLILIAKRIKKFKLILEINELYSDVSESNAKFRNKEIEAIDTADALVFPNTLMHALFNHKRKPIVVEHGVYRRAPKLSSKFDDGKIHIVYAGTFEEEKGGAFTAIHASQFLPGNYHLHVLGFGTNEQIIAVKRAIEQIKPKCESTISFDGLKDGDDFQCFLQKCHIGLSTQRPGASYNDTSFPSKILTYLANGMQVVSIDIPVVKKSKLSNSITFYEENSPLSVASAIISITDFSPKFEILKELDTNLRESFSSLISQI